MDTDVDSTSSFESRETGLPVAVENSDVVALSEMRRWYTLDSVFGCASYVGLPSECDGDDSHNILAAPGLDGEASVIHCKTYSPGPDIGEVAIPLVGKDAAIA